MKNKALPYFILLCALGVSGSAAFYSVYGLSKLFSGASTAVIIMCGFLELSKLVTASLLYQYWDKINKILRTYLTIAVVTLMLITSMGIYGFLSSAYQTTFSSLAVTENEISFLKQKETFYSDDVIRYDKELERISGNITTLSSTKSNSIQVRDTTSSTGVRNTISTAGLRLAQERINIEEENRKDIQSKRSIASDSLQKYQLQILEKQNSTEVAGELGPLKYLSGITGMSMGKVINILLLVIIFVFDPLAIALVIAANFSFSQISKKKSLKPEVKWENLENSGLDTLLVEWEEPKTSSTKEEEDDLIEKIIEKHSPTNPTPRQQKIKDLETKFSTGTWSSKRRDELTKLKQDEDLNKTY